MTDEYQQRLSRQLKQELGPTIMAALGDDKVIEIILNADGKLWIERLGKPMKNEGTISAVNAKSLLDTIATSLGTQINIDRPVLEGHLALDGSRFTGLIPPVVTAPVFTIRKRARSVFTLNDYYDQDMLDLKAGNALVAAINARENIIIAGGTGTGKTTFGNALLAKLPPKDRLVIIEDTPELQPVSENQITLQTNSNQSMQQLLKTTLRLRPDRIIIGEVRGAEALTLLKAWNTGHGGGIATVHANNVDAALNRLENLVAESGQTVGVERLIAEAVGILVSIERIEREPYRYITAVARLIGYDKEAGYILETLYKLTDK